MKIDVYSHCFAVSNIPEHQVRIVQGFCKGLIQWKLDYVDGRKTYTPAKTFATSNATRDYYRFHLNCLTEFKQHLRYNQIGEREWQLTYHEAQITDRFIVEFPIKDLPAPWKAQPIIIDHVMAPGPNKIVTLQTGQGKTTIAKHCASRGGLRTAVFMRGGYIEQWVKDVAKTFHFNRGELLVIRGGSSVNSILEMALDNDFNAKLIFVSLNTYSEYINSYEEFGVTPEYPIAPTEFFDKLGIGFVVLDEAHQLPHQVMKFFTYMHVYKTLSLSATLDTRDKFMQRMYDLMYPTADRFNGGFYDAFIRVKDIRYRIARINQIKCTQRGAYSHNAFEASLMTRKNRKLLENYTEMICWYVDLFVQSMQKGQSMMLFFATINFCTMFTKELKDRYPHLNVVRYVGSKDKRAVVDDAEIVVTTVQSAGTALDKPNLRIGFMTNAMDTQQGNEQVLGRTRRLKDFPDVDAEFWCLTCVDINKHVLYTDNRKAAFKGKIASWTTEFAPINV